MALILGKSYLSVKKLICPSMAFEETSLSVTLNHKLKRLSQKIIRLNISIFQKLQKRIY